jgi:hypothetical protein
VRYSVQHDRTVPLLYKNFLAVKGIDNYPRTPSFSHICKCSNFLFFIFFLNSFVCFFSLLFFFSS